MKQEEIDYLIRYYLHLLPIEDKHTLKYPYLNEVERATEKMKRSALIIERYEDKVFWNLCPSCKRLARTPEAKQCRFCGHDWH